MNKFRKRLVYCVFVIATVVFFIYFLFPSEVVKEHIAFNLSKIDPDFNISIDYLNPVFPPGLRLHNVSLYHLHDTLIEIEQIRITPELLSFFGSSFTFSLSACKVDISMPVFNNRDVFFRKIEADMAMRNQELQLKQCNLTGEQVDGRISGYVTLKDPLNKSILNLTGTIEPHQLLLERLRKGLPANFLPKKISAESGFPFIIGGTFDRPVFSLE